MKELNLKVEERGYEQLLEFLKTLDYVQVIPVREKGIALSRRYDFSDLVGKLEWKGDAVQQQRLLRNEW
jgi:hypothetical protein